MTTYAVARREISRSCSHIFSILFVINDRHSRNTVRTEVLQYHFVHRKNKTLHRSNRMQTFAIKIVFEFPIVTSLLGCGVDSRSEIDDRKTSISPSTTSFRLIAESLQLSHRSDTTIALILRATHGIQYVFYLTEFCLFGVNRKCPNETVIQING